MSAELGAVAATAPVPLLTAQVRVVKNEGESSNIGRHHLDLGSAADGGASVLGLSPIVLDDPALWSVSVQK